MRKVGAAFATFSLTYAFAFNAFNVIYFRPTATTLNGTSAIINAMAIVYMFKTFLKTSLGNHKKHGIPRPIDPSA